MENENNVIENSTESTEENSTVKEQVKTEKTFTQIELDRILNDRLAREKANTKKIKEDSDALLAGNDEKIAKYEEVLTKILEKEKAGIPEQYKKLLDKLSIQEQFEFLNDPKNKTERVSVPETPKAEGTKEPQPQQIKNFI